MYHKLLIRSVLQQDLPILNLLDFTYLQWKILFYDFYTQTHVSVQCSRVYSVHCYCIALRFAEIDFCVYIFQQNEYGFKPSPNVYN